MASTLERRATTPVVGWIGLGSMGTGMAKRIQMHLFDQGQGALRVYNRTASRCSPLEEMNAQKCDSIGQIAQECDILFLSSSADTAVISIIDQIIESGIIRGKIVVDTTTVHPDTTKSIAAKLSTEGAGFAAMPVFGASPAAAAGTLLAAFAGPKNVLRQVSPFMKGVIAREVLVVGTVPEQALLLKTTSNLLMASLMQIIAEAHVFASKTGLPAETLERLLELNFGPVAHSDSIRMTTGVYCPGQGQVPWSDLNLAIKDVGHAIELAEREGANLPASRIAYEGLGKAREWANNEGRVSADEPRRLDSTSLFGVARKESGLDFESDYVKERDEKAREDHENHG
ncbi:NAD binding domain of 6-phosphogluconate dehydrogenase-domain-containing protein [Truncatella angustata]|uniref:NAD binding domain of 6-phosphogluconate dehydrogenase-domain-containing protein n=1 Tax=Truncatella angustata TaxID=152316 RepID=A0A9P8UMY9_9PEZI|nr:NAD binding domain of 6-phosphogluconate dehydrogenase-domain-containing protein [Truncatella angustata]KAH6654870.1 NAD binding domain of 6-phosphogluconate dehydrogenase-domain-containing protein [Truncatella angustata]